MQAVHNMTKVVQDRVSPSYHAMEIDCEAPVNAMDMNRDMTQVVVAGRTVFKIISIEDEHFMETANLRVGKQKNMNLNYSAADVAWNHTDENILASAATNGAVVIWNLNKQVKSKPEYVFTEHRRSVNRVVFHSSESHQLLSGSQDGTMMLHDLRRKQVTVTFKGSSSESVRDIQFCSASLGYFNFAAAYENGLVQIWDLRRPDRCEKHFTAHNEPVFAIDWHPDDKNWLATAGRDKMIKVWDLGKQPAHLLYMVQTIASVGRIKWRPQRRFHIANCSLLLDHSVNVWDVRRPYIPFASFDKHKDVATCVKWKDPHVLLSTGKDNMLIQHVFADAKRPGDHVIPCGVDISIHGDVGSAFRDKNAGKGKESGGKTSMFSRKTSQSRSELFFSMASSSLTVFQQIAEPAEEDVLMVGSVHLASQDFSVGSFLELARNYRLKGQTVEEVCRHNSAVAAAFNKCQIAQMWHLLGDIFYTKTATKSSSLQVPRVNAAPNTLSEKQDADKGKAVSSPDNEQEAVIRSDNDKEKNADCSTGTDEDSEGESSEYEKNLANIASGLGHGGDFFFGDGDDILSYPLSINMRAGEDWTHLPSEAFQPRHEITGPTAPPDRSDHDSLLVAAVEPEALPFPTPIQNAAEDPEPSEQYLNLNIDGQALHCGPSLDFTAMAAQMIRSLAEQGDIQTAVSMLIVLGDQVWSYVDMETLENWFLCYIDLLSRYELWTIANEVISLSHLPQVNQLNQASTTIHTSCPNCIRPMERAGWLCDRCKKVVSLCSICHHPVKGLSVWCQGCLHGGHYQHIQEWLASNTLCPAGCGHACEYT